jgi:pimeloyl-ACP methyl ester carboxylesterase
MIWSILYYFFWALVVVALAAYASLLASRFFRLDRTPDEIHYATTSDGWRVAVWRYRPRVARATEPVVLLHGLGANAINLDFTDELSLARHLATAGYDVWLVEFRGRGRSTTPRLFSKFRWDWSFDEYVERDIPAAVAEVVRATGRDRLHFVGFSIGGMALYGYLSDLRRTETVLSAVVLGAPSSFKRQSRYLGGRLLRNLRWMRHQWMLRMLAPLSGYFPIGPSTLVRLHENLSGPLHRRALVNVTANFSRVEMLQYSDWILDDSFRSIDHRRDYRQEMARIQVPMLFVAGGKDMLAPPDSVKAAYEAVGSKDKRFVIASRGSGMRSNYGHEDLVMGKGAPEDVYPLVSGWLDAHATAGETTAAATTG